MLRMPSVARAAAGAIPIVTAAERRRDHDDHDNEAAKNGGGGEKSGGCSRAQPLTLAFSADPAEKRGTLPPGIVIRSPVRGLTPWRGPRSAT